MKSDTARMTLTVVAGVLVVLAVVLTGLAVTYPEIVQQSSLGTEFFLANLGYTGNGLAAVTGFRPVADGLLLLGSYVLVCLIIWSQAKLQEYLKTRGHVD